MGPMTGRGAGYCAGYGVPGSMNPGGGRGLGRGFGRGRGGGRGLGWGRRNPYAVGAPLPPVGVAPQAPASEVEMLRAQAEQLADVLDQVRSRIEQLQPDQSQPE